MDPTTQELRDFAERLILHETIGDKSYESKLPAALRATEKLRPHLSKIIGAIGFQALLSRSLALAKTDVLSLADVHIKADGSFEGINVYKSQSKSDDVFEGYIVLLARLLELLVSFIGIDLTLQLVLDAWPEISTYRLDFVQGKKNEKAN